MATARHAAILEVDVHRIEGSWSVDMYSCGGSPVLVAAWRGEADGALVVMIRLRPDLPGVPEDHDDTGLEIQAHAVGVSDEGAALVALNDLFGAVRIREAERARRPGVRSRAGRRGSCQGSRC